MIEILREAAVETAERAREGYVTVRFAARHATFGPVETVRTFRLPPAAAIDALLQKEYARWIERLDATADW